MSSSGYDNATIVSSIANGQSIAWTVLATAAFQVYDYMICLDREPVLFWRYPFTAASILYIVNRYSGLVRALYYIIAEFTQYRPQSIEGCIAQWYTSYAFDLTPLLPAAVFSSLRTYALTQHITLAVLVFVLSLGPFVVNWTGHSWSATFEIDPVLGCSTSLAVTPTIAKIFATTARLPLVIADLIVVVVTWIKTYELRRAARSFGIASLADVMFRNGNVYAITSLLMNITHFTLTMLSAFGAANNDGHSSFFSRIIDPLTGVLVSRFLLDLQEAAADQKHLHSYTSTSTIRFEGIIGSLAASLPGPLSDPDLSSWGSEEDADSLGAGAAADRAWDDGTDRQ